MHVTFQDKSFVCHSLEQIKLGSRNDKWSIVIGGKTLDNTGLQKQNKIRKINWGKKYDWDDKPIFQDENDKPETIVEIPGKSYVT